MISILCGCSADKCHPIFDDEISPPYVWRHFDAYVFLFFYFKKTRTVATGHLFGHRPPLLLLPCTISLSS